MILLRKRGFTLIELLVVVAIIGILASVVLASLSSARTRARNVKVTADLRGIITKIELKRDEVNDVLRVITGSNYTAGGAGGACTAVDLRGISDSSTCGVWLNTQFQKIGFTSVPRDPWNSPYLMDENELEGGVCNFKDGIRSVGPDGMFLTGDDINVYAPFFTCPG